MNFKIKMILINHKLIKIVLKYHVKIQKNNKKILNKIKIIKIYKTIELNLKFLKYI